MNLTTHKGKCLAPVQHPDKPETILAEGDALETTNKQAFDELVGLGQVEPDKASKPEKSAPVAKPE